MKKGEVIPSSMIGKVRPKSSFPWSPNTDEVRKAASLVLGYLKPCPFCGARPSAFGCGCSNSSGLKVVCPKCGVPKVCESFYDYEKEYCSRTKLDVTDVPWTIFVAGSLNRIIKAWNRRVED